MEKELTEEENQSIIDVKEECNPFNCKIMIIHDSYLFGFEHFLALKELIESDPNLVYIITEIVFKNSSLNINKIKIEGPVELSQIRQKNTVSVSNIIECSIVSKINKEVDPSLAATQVMHEIYNLIRKDLKFH